MPRFKECESCGIESQRVEHRDDFDLDLCDDCYEEWEDTEEEKFQEGR